MAWTIIETIRTIVAALLNFLNASIMFGTVFQTVQTCISIIINTLNSLRNALNDHWNDSNDRSSFITLPERVQYAWNSVSNSPNMYSNYHKHLERIIKCLERS